MRTLPVMKTIRTIDRIATGQELRLRRTKAGLTLAEVAEKMETHVTEIHRLERGTLPVTKELIERVAVILAKQ